MAAERGRAHRKTGEIAMDTRRWLVALVLLCATFLHAEPVPLADLARHMQYEAVKISPDGKYLATTALVDGHSLLALIRLADKKGQLIRQRNEDAVTDFWWISPTRVVYTVGTRLGGYDRPLPTGELYAVNADGTGSTMLYGFRKDGMTTGTLVKQVVSERGSAEFIGRHGVLDFLTDVLRGEAMSTGRACCRGLTASLIERSGIRSRLRFGPVHRATSRSTHPRLTEVSGSPLLSWPTRQ